MTAEELAAANERLANPQAFEAEPAKVLGLIVVGHLANRLGVSVRLTESVTRGVAAQIQLPDSFLGVSTPVEEAGELTGAAPALQAASIAPAAPVAALSSAPSTSNASNGASPSGLADGGFAPLPQRRPAVAAPAPSAAAMPAPAVSSPASLAAPVGPGCPGCPGRRERVGPHRRSPDASPRCQPATRSCGKPRGPGPGTFRRRSAFVAQQLAARCERRPLAWPRDRSRRTCRRVRPVQRRSLSPRSFPVAPRTSRSQGFAP